MYFENWVKNFMKALALSWRDNFSWKVHRNTKENQKLFNNQSRRLLICQSSRHQSSTKVHFQVPKFHVPLSLRSLCGSV